MKRTCRCGATYEGDTLSMIHHVTSDEHSARLNALGIVDHNHSYRYIDAAGHPVEESHPEARPYVSADCRGCQAEDWKNPENIAAATAYTDSVLSD